MQTIFRSRGEGDMVALGYEQTGNRHLSLVMVSLPGCCFCIDVGQKGEMYIDVHSMHKGGPM